MQPRAATPSGGVRAGAAYDYIKEQLLDGRYRPGDRLPVQTFVEALGISRHPVMVALQQLAKDNLVEIIPQVGCVATVDPRPVIDDFYRFFAAAEGLMAGMAAERCTDAEVRQLKRLSGSIGALMRSGLSAATRGLKYRKLNRDLHAQIHAMARSPQLARDIARLWDRSDYYISTGGSDVPFARRLPVAHREHERICAAIARRDPAGARRAMEAHILTSLSSVTANQMAGSARAATARAPRSRARRPAVRTGRAGTRGAAG
ncbi:MAG: GntR family transcriptional regulator [Acidobacteriota bacterium]|nr:GntR family transcriptional regulator [Acidobacteriota bacterium]